MLFSLIWCTAWYDSDNIFQWKRHIFNICFAKLYFEIMQSYKFCLKGFRKKLKKSFRALGKSPDKLHSQTKKILRITEESQKIFNLPFPRMFGTAKPLGGGVGDRDPSLGSAPFTCFSLSIFMCSIQRRGRPMPRLACKVSMAAVAVETVESMTGAGSPSHPSSASS